jgi:hypothetical protein
MQLSNIPGKLVLPFANAGGKNAIPVASQIGITAGAASLVDGFPPLTRTPIAAGGVPPSGLDMNGIIYELSAVIRWANAGGGYPFDNAFATDPNVGGYPKGARIMRADGAGYWYNTTDNNVTDPESSGAAAAGWVPDFTTGVAAVTMTGANVTLTPAQYGKPMLVITGTLTGNLNLIFPNIFGDWIVLDNTSGNFAITAKTSSGIGVILPKMLAVSVYCDGTNVTSGMVDLANETLTFNRFIPKTVDVATQDCSTYIQNALITAFALGRNISGYGDYAINQTLIIPQYFDYTGRGIEIDCGNCRFKLLSDIPLFTSGYYNSGTLITNYGTALDSHFSVGVKLNSFDVSSNFGAITQPVLKIQDWHQGSEIKNISSFLAEQMLWSKNNYYCHFDDIRSFWSGARTGDRFIFFDSHNLNTLSRLVATNSITGYRFDGPVVALTMRECSFEGQTVGAAFNATVYDVEISGSYIERIDDVAIAFNSYVLGAKLENNYVNFLNSPTTFFVYYNLLPGNVIEISRDNYFNNMPSVANIIKVCEDVYGAGIVIERATDSGVLLSDLLVDNSKIGRNIEWRQKKKFTGFVGNVNNDYIAGNYSGRFTNGYDNTNGFAWVNTSSTTLSLTTKIRQNFVQLVYVNIQVVFSGGPTTISGFFIGNTFYKLGITGLLPSTDLTASTDANGFLKIDGGYYFASTVTGCVGEIRLI